MVVMNVWMKKSMNEQRHEEWIKKINKYTDQVGVERIMKR